MQSRDFVQLFPIVAVATIATYLLYRAVKFGGLRGMLFGARVRKTIGETRGAAGWISTKLRVSVLDGSKAERAIGLDLTMTSIGSWQLMPMTLSVEQAEEVIEHLNNAINEKKDHAR